MAWTALTNGPVPDIGLVTGATTPTLGVNRAANPFYSSGPLFRCVLTTPCGNETSNDAALTVCQANFNCDNFINSQDFYDFLLPFFAGDADFNRDGLTNSQDLFDFLGVLLAGC